MAKSNYKNSLRTGWTRFSTWFLNLDFSDKIGVVLIALTGVGLLAMLLSGSLKNFLTLPGAEAKEAPELGMIKGCESFDLKSGSSVLTAPVIVIGEEHSRHALVSKCMDAILTLRGSPSHRIFREGVTLGEQVSCSSLPFGDAERKQRECYGWDSVGLKQSREREAYVKMLMENYDWSWLTKLFKREVREKINEIVEKAIEASPYTSLEINRLPDKSDHLELQRARMEIQVVEAFMWKYYEYKDLRVSERKQSVLTAFHKELFLSFEKMEERNQGLAHVIQKSVLADEADSVITFVIAGHCHLNPCHYRDFDIAGSEAAPVRVINDNKNRVALLLIQLRNTKESLASGYSQEL